MGRAHRLAVGGLAACTLGSAAARLPTELTHIVNGSEVRSSKRAEFAALTKRDMRTWRDVVRSAALRAA